MTKDPARPVASSRTPAILLDLDGTLMDSNYEHVAAWRLAFRRAGFEVANAVLHRFIGMRDALLIDAVFREIGRTRRHQVEKLIKLHKAYFQKSLRTIRPLPGAAALLKGLSRRNGAWAIATGGDKQTVAKMIRPLAVPRSVPIITADDVDQAKPEDDGSGRV